MSTCRLPSSTKKKKQPTTYCIISSQSRNLSYCANFLPPSLASASATACSRPAWCCRRTHHRQHHWYFFSRADSCPVALGCWRPSSPLRSCLSFDCDCFHVQGMNERSINKFITPPPRSWNNGLGKKKHKYTHNWRPYGILSFIISSTGHIFSSLAFFYIFIFSFFFCRHDIIYPYQVLVNL